MENKSIQDIKDRLYRRVSNSRNNSLEESNITPKFVLLFAMFTLAWYILVSSSSAFFAIVRIFFHIANTLFTQFLNPETVQGLKLILTKSVSPLHLVTKILYILSQFFIVVGILISSRKVINVKFGKEYKAFAIFNLFLCLAGIAIPVVASSLNTTRLYHITLFFLAPFCVIGGIATFNGINKVSGKRLSEESMKVSLKLLSIFFALFLLFTSGFIYEVTKDNPYSISLDNTIDTPRFNDKEVHAAKWLTDVTDSYPIHADGYGHLLLREFDYYRVRIFLSESKGLPSGAYVYLRSLNLKGITTNRDKYGYFNVELSNSTFYNNVITMKNMIHLRSVTFIVFEKLPDLTV